jgi:hypothetical protein
MGSAAALAERDGFGRCAQAAKRLPQTAAGSFIGSADEAYAAIWASSHDLAAIAGRTGIEPAKIQKVKDHLFNFG